MSYVRNNSSTSLFEAILRILIRLKVGIGTTKDGEVMFGLFLVSKSGSSDSVLKLTKKSNKSSLLQKKSKKFNFN